MNSRRRRVDTSTRRCNVASSSSAWSFEERAVAVLRASGLRVTAPRVEVIRALGETNRALSANEIHRKIAGRGGRIDAVSVYRILATLMASELVHRIGLVDRYIACRTAEGAIHDVQHLVCSDCGCVAELDLAPGAAARLGWKEAGFRPSEIRVEVLGVCAHCRSSKAGRPRVP